MGKQICPDCGGEMGETEDIHEVYRRQIPFTDKTIIILSSKSVPFCSRCYLDERETSYMEKTYEAGYDDGFHAGLCENDGWM